MRKSKNWSGSGARESADELERYGIAVFGSRHHSQPFGPTAVANLCNREGEPDRSERRNVSAAAVALVRGCLVDVFGQAMTEDQIFDVAMKVQRTIRAARTKSLNAAIAPGDTRDAKDTAGEKGGDG